MDLEEKVGLVKRPPAEEVVTEPDLRTLFEREPHPKHYVGLEVSGVLNLGSLLLNSFKINDFMAAGMKCTVFLADWHSYINNKWGGDWAMIERMAKEYYADAFSFLCPGVQVRFGSDLYRGNDEYWRNLLRFSKQISLERDVRCLTIMGRTTKDKLDVAQYVYPPMQATDIWAMDLDVVQAGMDQRKVHMLAREVFPSLHWKVPVAVHHHILAGLGEPRTTGVDEDTAADRVISSKMSKSRPESAILIHDGPEEISRKVGKAWCPDRVVEGNPVLEYARYVVFHERTSLRVERPEKYGGDVTYDTYAGLERDYGAGKLHPTDLKHAVASALSEILRPVRKHFDGKEITKEVLSA